MESKEEIEYVNVGKGTNKGKPTPVTLPLLHKDVKDKPRKCEWNYRAANCMLNLLTGKTRPDINMVVHQTSRFNKNPTWKHEKAIMRICRYLVGTKDRGMVYRPD